MIWTRLFLLMIVLLAAACGRLGHLPLPFPTPAQHDLVALVQPGPLTHTGEDAGNNGSGLEHDLIEAFAQELGVGVRFVVASGAEFREKLNDSEYHLAAGWLSPQGSGPLKEAPPLFQTRDILVQHEASLPLTEIGELAGKKVHVMAGSRQARTLQVLARQVPGLEIAEVALGDIFDLLEALGERRVEYVVIDDKLEDIANQFVPTLRATLPLSKPQPVGWLLGAHPNSELEARLAAFIERVRQDGTLARLEERYLGHVRRLQQADVVKFLAQTESMLPKLRPLFQAAEAITGLDWRLIAAVAYQESHWDASATSRTNVRGIMMLTEETADRMGVSNRLNARESIVAGARYINLLKDQLPDATGEPDRTWLSLAAYNIGPGNFGAARRLAEMMNANPDAWYDMKRILPLLAQAKYAQRVKSGRARGGEAVILVENIRSYYDILVRHEQPYVARSSKSETAGSTAKTRRTHPPQRPRR